MTVGILGLGLIGGSMARAYTLEGHTVYAAEQNQEMLSFAMLAGAVHGELDASTIGQCDLILLAIYPGGCIDWLKKHAHLISKDTLVMDLCGIKREICNHCFPIAEEYGFTFIGGHPMAGSQFSGFKHSRATLFKGAPMVLVPHRFDDPALLERATIALTPCQFGSFSVTTADNHDRVIAFTSQIPHIVSNAYIKSPTSRNHKGFSAGSYKDMTRVAWLNARMWAELCMENRDHSLFELDCYIKSLECYRDALKNRDLEKLTALLEEGKQIKEEVDG